MVTPQGGQDPEGAWSHQLHGGDTWGPQDRAAGDCHGQGCSLSVSAQRRSENSRGGWGPEQARGGALGALRSGPLSAPPQPSAHQLLPAGLPADCRGRWESFVEETLTETNRRNAVDLVRPAPAPPVARSPGCWGPWPHPSCQEAHCGQAPGTGLTPPTPVLLQVSTHHLHPSSEDEDMEGAFPNELSLQQVCMAGGAPLAALGPLGLPRGSSAHRTPCGTRPPPTCPA